MNKGHVHVHVGFLTFVRQLSEPVHSFPLVCPLCYLLQFFCHILCAWYTICALKCVYTCACVYHAMYHMNLRSPAHLSHIGSLGPDSHGQLHLCAIHKHVNCRHTTYIYIICVHVPLDNTCGKTSFVHTSSLVCAVQCSTRETVDMPTTFFVLQSKETSLMILECVYVCNNSGA